jgi:uncharacterized membrane protein
VLLAALAARPVGPLVVHDPATGATVAVPARSFAEDLTLGVGLIRRFGATEPTVIQALLRLLSTVLYACGDDPQRCATLENQANLLIAAAEREAVEPADLDIVYAEADTLRQALAARQPSAPRLPTDADPLPNTTPPT